MFKILLTSDLHYPTDNSNLVQTIIDHINPGIINVVVVAGDLTSHGYDGKVTCHCLFSCCTPNSGITGGSKTNELGIFKDQFVKPITEHGGVTSTHQSDVIAPNTTLLLVHGNHDKYNGAGRYPVLDYISNRYGDTHYTRQINNVYFFMCGLYPNKSTCQWIASTFNELGLTNDTPVIFVFHYNLYGACSDWWNDSEKDYFFETVKSFHVLAIFVGHSHQPGEGNFRGIRVINGFRTTVAEITINIDYTLSNRFIPLEK